MVSGTDQQPESASASRATDGGIDLDRLCVAARSVLDGLPAMLDVGIGGAQLTQLATHAGPLADLPTLRGLSLAAIQQHAMAVTTALARVGTDNALTAVVWFEDALFAGNVGGPR